MTAHAHDLDMPAAQRRQRIGIVRLRPQGFVEMLFGLSRIIVEPRPHQPHDARLITQRRRQPDMAVGRARVGGDGAPRIVFAALQAFQAGLGFHQRIGQRRPRGDGETGGGAAAAPLTHRLVVMAAGIEREQGAVFRGRRRQHQCEQRRFHFRNSPSSARRISAAVSAQPNRAAKEPKRGPAVWPNRTS